MRYTWIDYAKVISICLVISFHTPPRPEGYWGEVIGMLRMPAFFLIAGFLFKAKRFETLFDFVKHRSIQLLVPYFSFFFIFYILWLLFGRNLAGSEDMAIHPLTPLYEFVMGNPVTVVAPCWFLCCLFSMQIIYYLLAKYLSSFWIVTIVFLMPFLNCLGDLYHLPWCLAWSFRYMPFYAIPNLLRERIIDFTANKWWMLALLTLMSGMGCMFIHYYFENVWLSTLTEIIGGLLLLPTYILLCKSIAYCHIADSFAEFIGKNTIVILAIQNYIIGVFKIVCFHLYGSEFFDGNYIANACITLAVLFLSIIPILIINRYFPAMIGRGAYFNRLLGKG